jgi:predicted nucleic acid-binding protein
LKKPEGIGLELASFGRTIRSVRLYLNTSALNRPFDDLSSERVRLEAEAVVNLLSAAERGKAELVSSEFIEFELAQNPDPERAARVLSVLLTFPSRVPVSAETAKRAQDLERFGLRGLDALHVAAAEAAGAAMLVTTDDRMVRRATRAGDRLKVRVVRPSEALATMLGWGSA